jgi:hypothetical protein
VARILGHHLPIKLLGTRQITRLVGLDGTIKSLLKGYHHQIPRRKELVLLRTNVKEAMLPASLCSRRSEVVSVQVEQTPYFALHVMKIMADRLRRVTAAKIPG